MAGYKTEQEKSRTTPPPPKPKLTAAVQRRVVYSTPDGQVFGTHAEAVSYIHRRELEMWLADWLRAQEVPAAATIAGYLAADLKGQWVVTRRKAKGE